ncbi:MAG: Dihydrodipicolinate synthetase family, partial [Planctomycetota bacterium]
MKRALKMDGCWTAMTSPFTVDGHAIDMARWQSQLEWQAKGGVRGLVP